MASWVPFMQAHILAASRHYSHDEGFRLKKELSRRTVGARGNILGGEILREGREKGGKYLVTQNDTHSI